VTEPWRGRGRQPRRKKNAKRPPNRRAGGLRSEVAPARRWRQTAPRRADAASAQAGGPCPRNRGMRAGGRRLTRIRPDAGKGRREKRRCLRCAPRASCARARVVTGWRTPQGWPRRRTGPALWATASGVQPRSGVTGISGAAEYAPKKYSAEARYNHRRISPDRRAKPMTGRGACGVGPASGLARPGAAPYEGRAGNDGPGASTARWSARQRGATAVGASRRTARTCRAWRRRTRRPGAGPPGPESTAAGEGCETVRL
jgi:hypothetical protein